MTSPTGKLTSHNDNSTSEQMGTEQRDVSSSSVVDEKSNQVLANVTESSVIQLPGPAQCRLEKSCQTAEEESCIPENVQNVPVEINDAVNAFVVEGQMQSIPSQVNTSSVNELLDPPSGDVTNDISPERKSNSGNHSQLSGKGKKNSKLLKKKYMLRSLGSSDRALRSRRKEKPQEPEPNSNLVDGSNDGVKRKTRKKKKMRREEGVTDQFSKIRANLRYLLNRISYEQSLIDAYSGEGWKGYSMEKLKPEKELQRAKAEILRRKLKIRDLFRNLDSLCAEGKLPESLFDSEGEIDSEDIFCAKCQSKELCTNNDIILCDGVCDRGFHQLCLDPPLLTEDIPPGDEGWLCPGCDCKDDCIDLVNDSLGTNISLNDTWERVFPEAAKAADNNMDNLGLPSDDSDDDDYNPNGPEDVEVEGDESSSESSSGESEYASASEKLEGSHEDEKLEGPHEDQYLGLPSEDSEDDDYNPDALDVDSKVTEESSSSDFTSDSEDLTAAIEDSIPSGQDDVKNLKGSSKQKGKVGKNTSMADELSSLLESDPGQEGFTHVSGKRHVERLDYQKLYEETYHSDTSDDEDWTATKKKVTRNETLVSPNGNSSNDPRHTPRARRNNHRKKVDDTNNSPTKSPDSYVRPGSNDKRRLGEAVVQRLYKSFKENQYPVRSTKESLAQELGLTYQQVTKWFDNTRWGFRHSSQTKTNPGRKTLQQATDSRPENEGEGECGLLSPGNSGKESKTLSSRKRKHFSEPQASKVRLDIDGSATDSPNGQEIQMVNNKTMKRK
ncbi:hypothetical protein RJT34_25357 [Clitoria ternatea]|uniref:Uncharacterized protein n=1 Tax=Clitoria ternatea TaxID=43366 RepID=A0AAN9FPV1_CLITE